MPFEFSCRRAAGDRLVFLVNMNGNIGYDTTAFDPTITYADGETHSASQEFSDEQGKNGWRYQYIEERQVRRPGLLPRPEAVAQGEGQRHRHAVRRRRQTSIPTSARTPPASGRRRRPGSVRVTGSVCNTGNGAGISAGYGFRMGTSSYAPWYALYGQRHQRGLFIGWDYFGHWASSFRIGRRRQRSRPSCNVAGHKQTLAPGESVTTPKAFVGLFRDDLDNAGNEVLDWQYRYLWDYTREGWFPAIRMLGYWMQGHRLGPAGRRLDRRQSGLRTALSARSSAWPT